MPRLSFVGGSIEISGHPQSSGLDTGFISSVRLADGLSAAASAGLQVGGMIRIATTTNTGGTLIESYHGAGRNSIGYVGIFNLQVAATVLVSALGGIIASVELAGWRNQMTLTAAGSTTYSGSYASDGLTIHAQRGSYDAARVVLVSVQGLSAASSITVSTQDGAIGTVNINTASMFNNTATTATIGQLSDSAQVYNAVTIR